MDLPTDDLKALIAELRELTLEQRDVAAAKLDAARKQAELAAEQQQWMREQHARSMEVWQASRADSSTRNSLHVHDTYYTRPNRLAVAALIVLAWSAVVSTILLVWMVRAT